MNTALAIISPIVLCIIINVFVMHPLLIRIFGINMFKDEGGKLYRRADNTRCNINVNICITTVNHCSRVCIADMQIA